MKTINEMREDLITRLYNNACEVADRETEPEKKLMILRETLNAISFSCEKLSAD